MSLDEYSEPKGAYYTSALVGRFLDEARAEATVANLRAAGFTAHDIQVGRLDDGIMVIVSEPTPGMLQEAQRILSASADDVRPYGSGAAT